MHCNEHATCEDVAFVLTALAKAGSEVERLREVLVEEVAMRLYYENDMSLIRWPALASYQMDQWRERARVALKEAPKR